MKPGEVGDAAVGAAAEVLAAFRRLFGRDGRVYFAPGRVNLIGEHTDYSGGFVLPASLTLGTYVAAAARDDAQVRVLSLDVGEEAAFGLPVDPRAARGDWSDYVAGVAWALGDRAPRGARGLDLLVSSRVPLGAGLSSSAALEVAVALALLAGWDVELDPLSIALACRRAENEFVGARCGVMDMFVATHGQAGHGVLLDCAGLTWSAVPIPAGHAWIVANSGVRHAISGPGYAERRAEVDALQAAVAALRGPVVPLRALDGAAVAALQPSLTEPLHRRLRHIVTENRRVLDAAECLGRADLDAVGRHLVASHESLRDDFEVSCRELDVLVDLALAQPGVLGARMIGGGFGGSTLTLCAAAHAADVCERLSAGYRETTGREAKLQICEFGAAARALE